MPSEKLILCTDLDRTLIPNGHQPEPPDARQRFARLVAQPNILLVYVSGRDQQLMTEAIDEYQLPFPDYAVTDVGASIYAVNERDWQPLKEWQEHIAPDWQGLDSWNMRDRLSLASGLDLQPEAKQAEHKLSYELHPSEQLSEAVLELKRELSKLGIRYNCIVSIDETKDQGLVDVLPGSADKRRALEFLGHYLGISLDCFVFSGDSGNDLAVLLSPMKATLVGNATDTIKQRARDELAEQHRQTLYFAEAYYGAGIIEGFLHYYPALANRLEMD